MLKSISLSVCLLLFSTNLIANPTLDSILQNHAKTLGNLKRWQDLQTLTIKLSIKEATFQAEGVYRVTRSGKMRIDIFADGKNVFTEAFNGKQGWQYHPSLEKPFIIDGEKAAALRHGIELPGHLFTLLDMQQQGHQLAYLGDENRQGKIVHILQLSLKDGHRKYYSIDPQSGLIVANRDQRAFHPDLDATHVVVETRPSDYRMINDMHRPFRSDNWDLTNNQWLATSQIIEMKINPSFNEEYFEPEWTEARDYSSKFIANNK